MNFTSAWVKSVQPAAAVTEHMDANTGLGLRVGVNGKKSWFARYTHKGKQQRINLGDFPAISLSGARLKLGELRRHLAEGIDPKGSQVAEDGKTVKWLITEYIEKHAKPNKRSWKFDETHLNKEIKDAWGERHIRSITKRDVLDVSDKIVARGAKVHAGRVLAIISKMFNWAVERDYLEMPPTYKVKAPQKTGKRARVLNEDEIAAFWKALDDPRHFSRQMVCALRLMLILAQRRGEVMGMKVSELDLEKKLWLLPGERTKNGTQHVVPLPDSALTLIRLAMKLSPSKVYVFGAAADEPMTATGPTRAMTRNREWLKKLGVEHVTVHDLRRTAATMMASIGVERMVISMVLNHTQKGMTAEVYDRYGYLPEKRRALEKWAAHLESLCAWSGH